MQANIPTEDEVLGYFKSLSNWGRWGDDDQLGALNLITPEKVKRAISLVQEGERISLSRTVHFEASLDALKNGAPDFSPDRAKMFDVFLVEFQSSVDTVFTLYRGQLIK